MYPVSTRFLEALATSHRIVTRVDAFYNGRLTVSDLPIADGSVTVDRGSKVRRSLSLTISDIGYLPWDPLDVLASYGQRLVVSRGIRFPDGSEEVVPLGTFRINEPSGDVHIGPLTITGQTSEVAIQEDKFLAPYTTKGYTTCVDAITALIRRTLPDAVIVNATRDGRNPPCATATWDANSDPWDAVTQIATAMAAEIYVDALDRFVIADVPDPLSSPIVWDIAEGEGGTLISAARTMSRTNVFNAVVCSGENTSDNSAVVSAVAYDNNPNSPTRWGGPYGRVPKFYSSSLLKTVGDCQAAANYMLVDATAPNISTSLDSVPNPALEGGDCIRVGYRGRKELFIMQSCSIPLTPDGDFSITLRGGKDDSAGSSS